jgi:hypothetical protein
MERKKNPKFLKISIMGRAKKKKKKTSASLAADPERERKPKINNVI